jgi:membrane protease subunit HflC
MRGITMRNIVAILVAILLIALVRMSLYAVDATEYVYVTQLGRHVDTFDGGNAELGAGLHVGWPWPIQVVTRLDRRLQQFDLPATELLTHDPEGKTIDKTLSVEATVLWKIAGKDAVERFIQRMGTPERASEILGQRVTSLLGAVIGRMRMDDLISVEPGTAPSRTHVDEKMEDLKDKLMSGLRESVDREYGIELVDIRLRRFNHPARVRDEIFNRIRSERQKKVAYYQSEGEKRAKNIESAADEKVRDMLAKARFEAEKIKGEADTEAIRIRNQAHSRDPEFYAFLKKLEKLQTILGDNKTVLLLSSHRPLFDLLFDPPQVSHGERRKTGKQKSGPPAAKKKEGP